MKQILEKSKILKIVEIFALFLAAPLILFFSIPIFYKIGYLLVGLVYILFISLFIEDFQKFFLDEKLRKKSIRLISIRLLIIVLLTTVVLYFKDKELLFNVILNKPSLWLKFSGIYILFSVIPQELIYRAFFVKRYQKLIKNKQIFILINALLFSFGHIWFKSWTVLLFTFIGSLLFLTMYLKTKSTWIVILEHSLYGVWLYTVGFGELFMFPV